MSTIIWIFKGILVAVAMLITLASLASEMCPNGVQSLACLAVLCPANHIAQIVRLSSRDAVCRLSITTRLCFGQREIILIPDSYIGN